MSLKKRTKTSLTPLFDLISLKKRKALITGAGAGIGRAIAYRFAEAGAALELVDINEESLNMVKQSSSSSALKSTFTGSIWLRKKR